MVGVLVSYKKSGTHIEHVVFATINDALDYAISATTKSRYTLVYSTETHEVFNLLIGGMYTPKVYRLTDIAKIEKLLGK